MINDVVQPAWLYVCMCYWGRVILIVSSAEELNPLPGGRKKREYTAHSPFTSICYS